MNIDHPREPADEASLPLSEHDRLIWLLEHIHDHLLRETDAALIAAELNDLATLARSELRREDGVLKQRLDEPILMVQQWEHMWLLQKLQVFRMRLAGGSQRLDRGELYDFLSEWLVGALRER
jgi:hypothetical protein